jgi:hypothetical protein
MIIIKKKKLLFSFFLRVLINMFKVTMLLQSGIFCILADALMKSEIYSDYVQVCTYL